MTQDWLLTLLAMSPYFLAATIVILALIPKPAQIEQDRSTSGRWFRPSGGRQVRGERTRSSHGHQSVGTTGAIAAKGAVTMEQMRERRSNLAGVLTALALVALTTGTGMLPAAQAQEVTPSAQLRDEAAVSIANFAFQPDTLQVAVGTAVTWTNSDSTAHTVTSDTGAFDAGALAPGASFTQTFTTPGTYTYHCQIHPFMTGTIVVS
ncbi:MAG: blue (type 1) copper domain protein [Thermomicrobiales bacterium]|jgi:plastocyanin|nr:blue (type 1) copper domain protein [Thermomicrobiales bacterium]